MLLKSVYVCACAGVERIYRKSFSHQHKPSSKEAVRKLLLPHVNRVDFVSDTCCRAL